MTYAQEWDQEFDILYNSINSNVAPSLDAYEKSVFLTLAQETIVKSLYNGDALGADAFESTEAVRRSLNNLIQEVIISPNDVKSNLGNTLYNLPTDVLYIVYEELRDENSGDSVIIPVTHDEYFKIKNNPFKGPSAKRVLRLDSGINNDEQKQQIELVGANGNYLCRYIKKPYPILLVDLSGTTDYINGQQIPLSRVCELDESLHRTILQTAVNLAISTYTK